jgi:hypothetical protein
VNKQVFKNLKERKNYYNNQDMVNLANLILKKCGSLPLAVSTIGSFLATKPNKSYGVEKSEQTYE